MKSNPTQLLIISLISLFISPLLFGQSKKSNFPEIIFSDSNSESVKSRHDTDKGWSCGDPITDPRDDKVYNTVLIGDQCWMAENLNIGQRIDAGVQMTDNGIFEKYCQDDNPANCDIYGGLYQWDEMMQYSTAQGDQGICMPGWRIPTDSEWKQLEGMVDSQYPVGDPEWNGWSWRGSDVAGHLKEAGTTHWLSPNTGADNSSGFTALPGGYAAGSSFSHFNTMGMFWSSTQHEGDNGIMRGLHYALTTNMRNSYSKAIAISVRCIRGAATTNEPPDPPSEPVPGNGSSGQAIDTDLYWVCTDPDDDDLTFDVYFGTQPDPPLVAEGIEETIYNPGTLDYLTNYYWKIVAHDDYGHTTEGPVWEFTSTDLFFTVTFFIENQAGEPVENAVVTLDGLSNEPGDYIFPEVPVGTFDYAVTHENYYPSWGEVTIIDQNIEVDVNLSEIVTIVDFPFTENFSSGQLPVGWQTTTFQGEYNWEFALNPFPHAFIHNISRDQVSARLSTPLIDASDLGQVTLGINQRFSSIPAGGTVSISISNDGITWQTVEQYTSSIGTGEEFQYIEYDITPYASQNIFFVGLNADFPDQKASYEAVWEIDSIVVFEPDYSVTFYLADTAGNVINDAVITLNETSNPAGNYVFENIVAGTYSYVAEAEGFIDQHGFVAVTDQNIADTVVMREAITITEFPYQQEFDQQTIPAGWNSIALADPDGNWSFNGEFTEIHSTWGDHTKALLVSPVFDCSSLESVAFGLNHYYIDIMSIGFAEILLRVDNGEWTTIDHFQGDAVGNNDFPYFEYYITEFAANEDSVQIAFLYDDLDETEFWWQIDAFSMFEPLPYAVSVENLSGNIYIDQGDSGTFGFVIQNNGAENDTYSFEVLNSTWDVEMSHQTLTLNAGLKDTVYATVHVPDNINMGENNELNLLVTSLGDETVTAESSFVAIGVSTIKEDYFENFDYVEEPDLPGGWSKIEESTAYWSRVETVGNASIDPVSFPNQLAINVANDTSANLVLISPKIDESVNLSDFRVLFKTRTTSNSALMLGTMDAPDGQFTPLENYSTTEHFTWEYFMYAFEDYTGSDRYIAFKLDYSETNTAAYLDDITIEIIPPPILTTDPESWDFGEYWVEYPSEVPLEIDVKNTGHYFLTISDIYLDNEDDFTLDYDHTLLNTQMFWNENIPLTVHFVASHTGPISGNIVIEYNDGTNKTHSIPLQGIGIPRPPGSTCDDPIYLELPVVDYENTTEFAGNDYNNFMVWPYAALLNGYDMDFRFTLEEESYLAASISGPYYGPSLYILDRCPDADNPALLYAWIEQAYGGSFENVILPAGEYHMVISSPAAASPYTYFTPFVLNLSAEPTPDKHSVTFNLYEDSPEQAPVEDAEISIRGFQTDLELYTNIQGQVQQDLYEYEYHVNIYKADYGIHDFMFTPTSDTVLNIPMNDLIWTPHSLNVETDGLYPGQALFTWIPKPEGEPWTESFEGDYPPPEWDTIVTNNGQVQEPGVDWKFTWQKYGPVIFSDITAYPVDGDYQAFVHWSAEPQDEWLISQEFEAPAGNLEFWYFGRNGSSYSDYYVKISNDGGETWSEAWNASDLPDGRNNYDYPVFVDLQPWAGQDIRIAWQAYSPLYGLEGAWCIDKISVGERKINPEDLKYISKTDRTAGENITGTIPSVRDGIDLPRVTFEDMNYNLGGTRVNEGFSVYLDDMQNPIAEGIDEPEYMFIGLDAGDYVAGVQAVYSTGQSEIVTIPFNNPGSGQLYLADFYVEDQQGQPVDNAEINITYAGSLVQTIYTQNGQAATDLYPGEYDFTVAHEGLKTYQGQFEIADNAVNLNIVMEEGYQITFLVKDQEDQFISNAIVNIDGITKNTDVQGTAIFELSPGEYPFTVTHPSYDPYLSNIDVTGNAVQEIVMDELSCKAPENLSAALSGTDVLLQWDKPEVGSEGSWLHWDELPSGNSIGSGGTVIFDVAQRFETLDIRPYAGQFLSRVWFVPWESNCTYTVKVWVGGDINGPDSLIVNQVVVNPLIGEWNEIFLQTPVSISDEMELWIGYQVDTENGYPAGVDAGPAIDGKGNMMRLPNSDWQTLLEVNPNLDYNWNIRGFAEPATSRQVAMNRLDDTAPDKFSGKLIVHNNSSGKTYHEPRTLLGYNVYRDGALINTQIVDDTLFTDPGLTSGEYGYNVTSVWSNGCESDFSNQAVLNIVSQQYTFNPGWNSFSSYVQPADPEITGLMAPMENNLVIMQNLTQVYWPQGGINSIGDFENSSGYALKATTETDFSISDTVYANTVIQLDEGWHYLPVLSTCPVNATELFGDFSNEIMFVQDLIGTGVYWPQMNINTLGSLIPGRAYKIKLLDQITLDFPPCSKGTPISTAHPTRLESPWGNIQLMPASEQVVFTGKALSKLKPDDLIGAFDEEGNIFGFIEVNRAEENHAMTLFGDDPLTSAQDGFAEGQPVMFRLLRPDTGIEYELQATYSLRYDNSSGKFFRNSFAVITDLEIISTGINHHGAGQVVIYPNPASEFVRLKAIGDHSEQMTVEFFSIKGEKVISKTFKQELFININRLTPGVYLVKVNSDNYSAISKLIIE